MDNYARTALLILVFLLATVGVAVARADSSGHTDLFWQVLSGGGAPAVSGSGRLAFNGSLGQTAIGPAAGGDSGLGAGYWYGVGGRLYPTYLPLLLRSH